MDGFLAAQHAWLEANLPENGVLLKAGEYGSATLPPKANRFYGKAGTGGESVGLFLDERTGKVEQVLFTVPAPATKREKGEDGLPDMPAKPRAAVTQKGEAMVGDMRTDALHAALREEPIDDGQLIALLVMAFAGNNVDVKSAVAGLNICHRERAEIANTLTEGGVVTSDPAVLRSAARAMLTHALSCRVQWSGSGEVARIAGDAIGADAHLPNMATQEFLSCLSKAAMQDVAVALNVPVQPTGRATRGAVIAKVGEGRWVHPTAAFSGDGLIASPDEPDDLDGDGDTAGPDLAEVARMARSDANEAAHAA